MKNSGKLVSFLVPIISILLAFVIGCIIMAVLGANPFVALESLWIGAFGSLRNVGTTLARSTPLIFTSLCACFAYRCGVFNLGGEGQFLMGSIVCCYIATQSGIEGLPAILLCLVGGAVAGGLWSLISGLLKVYRGQNEMIITIMLNYVATLFMGVVYTGCGTAAFRRRRPCRRPLSSAASSACGSPPPSSSPWRWDCWCTISCSTPPRASSCGPWA